MTGSNTPSCDRCGLREAVARLTRVEPCRCIVCIARDPTLPRAARYADALPGPRKARARKQATVAGVQLTAGQHPDGEL
jgi:hypothetical protein